MRMTPPIYIDVTKSGDAERRVFSLLEATDLGPHASAFHSLNISEHEYKLVGELDFVILAPEGLLVLEVKGGGVAVHDGIWEFLDRYGRSHTSREGPFRQGRTGMFSLRTRLRAELHSSILRGLVFGHGVVFPRTDFPYESVEWSPPMVLDAEKLRGKHDLEQPLRELFGYWRDKTPPAELVPPARLDKVAELLRPEFDKLPSLRYRADEIYTTMERLTEEQYEKLDMVEQSERVLCGGGAGTGKTFLAAEIARRDAAAGSRVLVTCKSPLLAVFLRNRVTDPRVDVIPLEEALSLSAEYDVLVVDEAQDVLDFQKLDQLGGLLSRGLEAGRWRFFYDANNQSSLYDTYDPDALEYLRSIAGSCGTVKRNCRNTRSIVIQTRLLTHADLGNPSAGVGPPVEYEFFDEQRHEATILENHLRSLLDEDVAPGDITILSPVAFEQSCVAVMRPKWQKRIRVLDQAAMAEWPVEAITFATVADFKGLENQFIALVDVTAVDPATRAKNVLYVAMSRARAGLWLAVDESLRDEVESLKLANLEDVLEENSVA